MANASSKTASVRGAGPSRGWWRRLRTCGIVAVVAMTVVLAAVYVASWRYHLQLIYVCEATTPHYHSMELWCDDGTLSMSKARGSSLGDHSMDGMVQAQWWSVSDGTRQGTWLRISNISWLWTPWPSSVQVRLEIPLVLLVATSAWLIARRVRAARVARRCGCPSCGYDLSGLTTAGGQLTCPECGGGGGGRAGVIEPDAAALQR